jgi:uncharacterized protein YjbI with pentapeptide repeats
MLLRKLTKINILFLVFIGCMIFSGVTGCMKKNLTKEEIDLLNDIDSFNKDYGSKGWKFKNRKVENIDISGITFKGSVISNVDFIQIKMKNSVFEDTKFSDVRLLHYSDVSGSTFKNVIFKNCKFENFIELKNTKFINCKFEDSELKGVYFRKSLFEKCTFKKINIVGGHFDGSQLNYIEFNNSNLKNASFTEKAVGKNLTFKDCTLKFSGFGGKFENVSFLGGVLDNSSFRQLEAKNLKIENCNKFIASGFCDSIVEEIIIIDCKEIQHFDAINSKINNFSIINTGKMTHLDLHSVEFSGTNIIKNVNIIGVELRDSKLNLQFENVSFDDFFFAKKVIFENMKLKDVKYLDKFNVEKMEDVEYINSDRFPEK